MIIRRRPFVADNSKKRGALFPIEAFPDAYRALREAVGPRGKVLLEVNPR